MFDARPMEISVTPKTLTKQNVLDAMTRGWYGLEWVNGRLFVDPLHVNEYISDYRNGCTQACALGAMSRGLGLEARVFQPKLSDILSPSMIAYASNGAGSKEKAIAAVTGLLNRVWPEGKEIQL